MISLIHGTTSKVRPYLRSEAFDPDVLKRRAPCAATCALFVINIVAYYDLRTGQGQSRAEMQEGIVVAKAKARADGAPEEATAVEEAAAAAEGAERAEILATISQKHSLISRNWIARNGFELKSAEEETYGLLLTDAARLVDEGVMEVECVQSCQSAARLVLELRSHVSGAELET